VVQITAIHLDGTKEHRFKLYTCECSYKIIMQSVILEDDKYITFLDGGNNIE
jgi:hypothetical protein